MSFLMDTAEVRILLQELEKWWGKWKESKKDFNKYFGEKKREQ